MFFFQEILGTCRVLCSTFGTCLCSVPQNDHTIQVALKVLATKHLSLKGWADITVELDSTVNDGNDKYLSAVLCFIYGKVVFHWCLHTVAHIETLFFTIKQDVQYATRQ